MNKTKFFTLYDRPETKPTTPTGEKIELRHEPNISETGKRYLSKTRKQNTYELIQIGREETEVARIVNRAMNGDYNALNAMQGTFTDITDAPKSLAQAQQFIINAERDFKELPKEIQKEFEYDSKQFIAAAGTKEWYDKMGVTAELEKKEVAKAEELKTKKDYQKAMAMIAEGATTAITPQTATAKTEEVKQ